MKELFLYALLIVTPATNSPQQVCSLHKSIVDQLAAKFSEYLVSDGLAANGSWIEVFQSRDEPVTWTIIMTVPNGGMTCIVASGTNWMQYGVEELYPEETI